MDPSVQLTGSGPLRRTVTITTPHGFHLRPMQIFVELAAKFQCTIRLSRDGEEPVDGRSMWDLLRLVSPQGTVFTLEVDGADAPTAIEELGDFLANLETRVNMEETS